MVQHHHTLIRGLAVLTVVSALAATVRAYPVAAALSFEKVVEESDTILKVKVVSSQLIADDPWFKPVPGFAVQATTVRVISILKGEQRAPGAPPLELVFRHYAERKNGFGIAYMPQHYNLEVGKPYIIFADRTDDPGVLRQLWLHHRGKEDQGVFRAADDRPVGEFTGNIVELVVWDELTRMLASDEPRDAIYAIGQLNSMSDANHWSQLQDFERARVMKAIAPLLQSKDAEVATAAVDAVGAASPYMRPHNAAHWLSFVGKGALLKRGYAEWPDRDNADAREYRAALIAIADNANANAELRGQAIRALGRVRHPDILEALPRWSKDRAAPVRSAAAVLWADYPGKPSHAPLRALARDGDSVVRIGAANAIGFAQELDLLGSLDVLLDDPDPKVYTAAGVSLISFDPDDVERILKARRGDKRFAPVFLNVLALKHPDAYANDLADAILDKLTPEVHLTSQTPQYTSWTVLMEYVESRPPADVTAGKCDRWLDALEFPPDIGSGPYQTLYRFYVARGLKDRAKAFRAEARKRVKFDIDKFFDQIDGGQN